jgi:hypothetical protein
MVRKRSEHHSVHHDIHTLHLGGHLLELCGTPLIVAVRKAHNAPKHGTVCSFFSSTERVTRDRNGVEQAGSAVSYHLIDSLFKAFEHPGELHGDADVSAEEAQADLVHVVARHRAIRIGPEELLSHIQLRQLVHIVLHFLLTRTTKYCIEGLRGIIKVIRITKIMQRKKLSEYEDSKSALPDSAP